MKRHAGPILLGALIYVALTLAGYGLERVAFPTGSGSYPTWYVCSDVLLKAIAAIGPGFVAAWLCRQRGFAVGAMAGVVGVVAEFAIGAIGFGMSLSEYPGRIVFGLLAAGISSGLTNGVAGVAAEALRPRLLPSNPTIERDAPPAARPSL
jgi:hypothetical protein